MSESQLYQVLSKYISHEVPMETANLSHQTYYSSWPSWNLDSLPISHVPLSIDTNMKIRGIEWEFPALVLASNKMHKEGLLFLCGPPPIDVHPYTQSKYTKPNVKSQRENFSQQSSRTHSRSHSHTSHRSSIWNSALCLRWALRDGPQGGHWDKLPSKEVPRICGIYIHSDFANQWVSHAH